MAQGKRLGFWSGLVVGLGGVLVATGAFGGGMTVVPNSGPLGGGNTVVITSVPMDTTNVTMGGLFAQITATNGSDIDVVVPNLTTPGAKDVTVQTEAQGETTLPGAYTINAEARIFGIQKGWAEMAGLPADRARLQAGTLNGALYVFGGVQGGYGPRGPQYAQTNAFRFDGTHWAEVAGLPKVVAYHGAGVLNGTLYSVGGMDDTYAVYTNVYAFDGTNWTEVAGLPAPRSVVGADVFQGSLYVVGGFGAAGFVTNVFAFDGVNWSEVEGLPQALGYAQVRTLGNRLYAISGMDGSYQTSTNVYAFDGTHWTLHSTIPAFDTWRITAMSSAVFDGKINLAGHNSSDYWFQFDGTNWTEATDTPVYENPALGVLDGRLYGIGGYLGLESQTNAFSYPAFIEDPAAGVNPTSGSWTGGYTVVISGTNLSNGADITEVTICGAPIEELVSETSTQLVVKVGQAVQIGRGDVRTVSESFGTAVASSAFTYLGPGLDVLGTNSATIISGESPSYAKGSDFGHVQLGTLRTNTFTLENPGSEDNTIAGWALIGSEAFLCDLPATPFTLQTNSQQTFVVQYDPTAVGVGSHAATLVISNASPLGVYTVLLAGASMTIAPTNVGPWSGGTITLSNGYFGTITNVVVGGVSVTPSASGDNWFTLTLPASTNAGPADFIVQTSDNGDISLAGIYTYRPQGQIGVETADLHGVLCQYEFNNSMVDSLGNGLDMVSFNNSASSFAPDGWTWTASGNPGGGLVVDGPVSPTQGKHYTVRVQVAYQAVDSYRRFLRFLDSDTGPYVYDGQMYLYGLGNTGGPVNSAGDVMDYYLTRDDSIKQVTAWQVVNGEVVDCGTASDSGDQYTTLYNDDRPYWRFFHDDWSLGESTPGGTVRRIWLWDQVLSSNQISDIYHGALSGGVEPSTGSTNGGFQVVITGTNLGDGSDVTGVTLCGIEVQSIVSQSSTQIVVVAAASASVVTGDVRVVSTGFGETVKSNAFAYGTGAPVVGPVSLWRSPSQDLKAPDYLLLTNSVDPQGSDLSVVWVSPASTNGGTVALSGRWILYGPPPGDDSPDEFTFRVRNAFGAESEGQAVVRVLEPSIAGSTFNVAGVVPTDSNTVVRFVGIPGRQYDVQMTTNLVEEWQVVGTIQIGGLGFVVFTNEAAPAPTQYYRTIRAK